MKLERSISETTRKKYLLSIPRKKNGESRVQKMMDKPHKSKLHSSSHQFYHKFFKELTLVMNLFYFCKKSNKISNLRVLSIFDRSFHYFQKKSIKFLESLNFDLEDPNSKEKNVIYKIFITFQVIFIQENIEKRIDHLLDYIDSMRPKVANIRSKFIV